MPMPSKRNSSPVAIDSVPRERNHMMNKHPQAN